MKDTRRAHIFFIAFLVWQMFFAAVFVLLNSWLGFAAHMSGGGLIITSQLFGNGIPLLVMLFIRGKTGYPPIPYKKPQARLTLLAIALGLLLQPIGGFLSYIGTSIGLDNTAIETIQSGIFQFGFAEGLLIIAVVPAVTEELICRGIILAGYRDISARKAALVSGCLFGIMHGNLQQFIYAFAMGYMIALVVIRSESVIYGIIMHFTVNASQFVLSRAIEDAPVVHGVAEYAPSAGETLVSVLWLAAFAAVCLAVWNRVYRYFGKLCGERGLREMRAERICRVSLCCACVIGVLFMMFSA